VIDLREELAALGGESSHAPWRRSTATTLDAVARLFDKPNAERFSAALASTSQAIEQLQQQLDAQRPPRDERHRLQRILSHLHFIRTALLDPQSPLDPFNADKRDARTAPLNQGAHHAA
jgi:uncharacterized membrane protein YccC